MSRAIDRLPTPAHTREKKVIVTARSRTGTHSIYKALKILGYRPHHMAEVITNGPTTMQIFVEALAAKYLGIGKPYGKAEFDKWFANYDALIEMPAFFLDEIVAAYPDAKFLHVERDVDKWYKSCLHSLGPQLHAFESFPLRQLRLIDDLVDKFACLNDMLKRTICYGKYVEDAEKEMKQDTIKLNKRVKEIIPKEKLAVFQLEDGFGWEQICSYLGHPIPSEPYPRGNTPKEFQAMAEEFLAPALRKGAMVAASLVLVPAVAVATWYYQRQG